MIDGPGAQASGQTTWKKFATPLAREVWMMMTIVEAVSSQSKLILYRKIYLFCQLVYFLKVYGWELPILDGKILHAVEGKAHSLPFVYLVCNWCPTPRLIGWALGLE
jgi:O-antigen ligase